jgi:hypothetical protein
MGAMDHGKGGDLGSRGVDPMKRYPRFHACPQLLEASLYLNHQSAEKVVGLVLSPFCNELLSFVSRISTLFLAFSVATLYIFEML